MRRLQIVPGLAVTAFASYSASRRWGHPDAVIHVAFALAGVLGLRLRSWPVICALAGLYVGCVVGSTLGDSPINTPSHALLLAVCGVALGILLETLGSGVASVDGPPIRGGREPCSESSGIQQS